MPENNPAQQTQQTQVGNNDSINGGTSPTFDIHNLPPEFVKYLDQERTKASKTARANAKKELMNDETFLNEIRGNIEPQVKQNAENEMRDQIKALNLRASRSEVTSILKDAGIKGEDLDSCVKLFVSENVDKSVEQAKAFTSVFNNTLQSKIDKQQQVDLQSMASPQTNADPMTEKDNLQSQLDEARKDTSYMRDVRISAILRSASEKGIKLI